MQDNVMFRPPLAFIFAGLLAVSGCREPLTPSTPPLLEKVTAAGGWWNGGCPPKDKLEADRWKPSEEALSPELMARLSGQFPVGSPASRLEQNLKQQGFIVRRPCNEIPTIRVGEFRQSGGGLDGPYPIWAQVAWKQDATGKIMWTKGTVAFTGP